MRPTLSLDGLSLLAFCRHALALRPALRLGCGYSIAGRSARCHERTGPGGLHRAFAVTLEEEHHDSVLRSMSTPE